MIAIRILSAKEQLTRASMEESGRTDIHKPSKILANTKTIKTTPDLHIAQLWIRTPRELIKLPRTEALIYNITSLLVSS